MALHTYSILPGFPELRGMRARLRAPRADDAEALQGAVADPAGYLAECVGFLAGGDRIDWIVTARRDDLALGTCTLHAIDRCARTAEIGYALRPDARGRGLATDAVVQATAWAFRALALTRIDAEVDPSNHASQRVLERAGFARSAPDRYCLACSAATAGSVLPSRNSRNAPPPVEM